MPDDPNLEDLPRAVVVPRRRARISVVWIIPILAAVVAIGIAVQRVLNEGPTITIVFKAAAGLEAGKTFVKYKDVNIGQVTKVALSPDHTRVQVTAKMEKSVADLMVVDAKFWVVEPRVTLSGVSGLGTLLSGNYIGFEIGKSDRKESRFTALETPPIITGGQPGRQFVLRAENLGSLGIGSPVYYRRLQAGQVVGYELAADGAAVELKVFVNAPYDQYVHPGTRFWNASGFDVSLGAGGVEVRTESIVALIAGGLAFDTPSFLPRGTTAAADTAFSLYPDRATAMKQPESIAVRYVLYFNESLRGLSVGAPVTLLGLQAGEVTGVGLDIDPATSKIRGRVELVSYPERLIAHLGRQQKAEIGAQLARSSGQRHALIQALVERRGLRAQLRSGNLLTGQLYIAFDYFPHAPKSKVDWSREEPELPSVPSTLPDIEAKLTSIIAKLDQLPLEAIGDDVRKALKHLDTTLEDASSALKHIDTDVTPGLKTTLEDLRRAVGSADAALKSADGVLKSTDATLLGADAPGQQQIRDALQEIARAARAVRDLADYLERHPESLLRGKTEETP
jgi:paraquat-inducible protein B